MGGWGGGLASPRGKSLETRGADADTARVEDERCELGGVDEGREPGDSGGDGEWESLDVCDGKSGRMLNTWLVEAARRRVMDLLRRSQIFE